MEIRTHTDPRLGSVNRNLRSGIEDADRTSVAYMYAALTESADRIQVNWGATQRGIAQQLYPGVIYAPAFINYDACLSDTQATFDSLLDDWFYRYNTWARARGVPQLDIEFPRTGPLPNGPWNALELQHAIDITRDYEALYHAATQARHHPYRWLYGHRYYRRMLEMKFFISTYFKTPELQLAAQLQLSGLYCTENLPELLLVINRRTSLLQEWLQDNRGHENSSEYSQEYTLRSF